MKKDELLKEIEAKLKSFETAFKLCHISADKLVKDLSTFKYEKLAKLHRQLFHLSLAEAHAELLKIYSRHTDSGWARLEAFGNDFPEQIVLKDKKKIFKKEYQRATNKDQNRESSKRSKLRSESAGTP